MDKLYAFAIILHSVEGSEKKYYTIESYLNHIGDDLTEFLANKLWTAVKYGDNSVAEGGHDDRGRVVEAETYELLLRYNLYGLSASAPVAAGGDGSAAGVAADADDTAGSSGLASRFGLDGLFDGGNGSLAGGSTTIMTSGRFVGLGPRSGSSSILGSRVRTVNEGEPLGGIDDIVTRPESTVSADDTDALNDYQV